MKTPQVKPDWPTGIAVGRRYYKGGMLGGSNPDGSVKGKPVTAKEMTFNKWLHQCDVVVSSKLGFGLHDLPDATWRDYFDDGLSPRDATDCAFDDQWGDEVPAELWYGESN